MKRMERLAVSAVAMAIVAGRRSRTYSQRLAESDSTLGLPQSPDPIFIYPRLLQPVLMAGH
jgi:hypothetical protein